MRKTAYQLALLGLLTISTPAVGQDCRPQDGEGPGGHDARMFALLRAPNQTRALAYSASPQVVLTVTACSLRNAISHGPAVLIPDLDNQIPQIPIPEGECRTATGKFIGVRTANTTPQGEAVVMYCIVTATPTADDYPEFRRDGTKPTPPPKSN